ncbi:MAG: hypothetical protein IJ087_10095 [Eggerthellaceae bacterium]|nr:hypothetical protein [Eggerthellaceae bacterium]
MISGMSVSVLRRVMSGRDEMGEPVFATSTETVGNVLVAPSSTDEMDETNRAFGVTCELTLHFPKSYTASLEGCAVEVRGVEYRVLGDPQPYMPENTPTPWNRSVKVARADG